jgi:hypothetical protein
MAQNVYSASRLLVDDVIVGRGQLGFGYSDTIGASATLWSFAKASKYIFNATANVSITLPTVGTASANAQPGHDITIKNSSASTGTITVVNDLLLSVIVLSPGQAAKIIADVAQSLDWYTVFSASAAVTLQEAYNNSGIAANVPKIGLSNLYGILDIRDSATPLVGLFSIGDSTNVYKYASFGNRTAGSTTPFVSLLGGLASTMTNSFAVGGTIASTTLTHTDTMLFSRPSSALAFVDISNHHITAYPTILKTAGNVVVGSTLTSPNEYTVWASSDLTNDVTATLVPLITLADNTTYRVTVNVVGRDIAPASAISSGHTITALVTRLGLVSTVEAQTDTGFDTVGYTVASVAVLSAAASVLSLSFTAPDHIVGATMPIRVVVTYSALTII